MRPALVPTGATTAPLSFAQERLWLVDTTDPGAATYNVPLLTRWLEPVDPVALAGALDLLTARHEVLRTVYRLVDDRPVQVVGPARPVHVEVVDAGQDLEARLAARATEPFDLATGPLLRCTVWRGAPGGDLVLLVVHHIAVDGWSLAPLYDDLAAAYRSVRCGEVPEWTDLPVRYTDFALWDRASAATPEGRRRIEARAVELVDVAGPLLLAGARPGHPPSGPHGRRTGRRTTFSLPTPLWTGMGELAGAVRATPFVVLHAALQVVVRHWSGREEFLLGTITANRVHPDVERLVGFFVNTVPTRCVVRPEWTFRQLCSATRAEAYRALTHQAIPFDLLTSTVAAASARGHQQLAQIGLVLQNTPAAQVSPPLWEPPVVLPTGTAKFDLLLIVEQAADDVIGILEYDVDLYPADVCDGVVADLLAVLTAAVADADLPLRSLPLAGALAGQALAEKPCIPVPGESTPGRRRAVEAFTEALTSTGALRGRDLVPESNFFTMGGHSLLAVTMLARAGRRHGVTVAPREFFADPTLARLGELLDDGVGQPGSRVPDSRRVDGGNEYPATSAQQRFWFLDRIEALRTAYLVPTVVRWNGPLDVDALRSAVDATLARHPALRSRFALDRKRRNVVYRTGGPPALATVTDVAGWHPSRLRQHLSHLCWTGFDLAEDAPARAAILTDDTASTLLVLVLHHIAADGWSRRLLLAEIADRYRGEPAPAAPVHPASLVRAPDPDQTEAMVRWLAGASTDVDLPRDRPRPAIQSTEAACTVAVLDPAVTAALRVVAAESSCTPFMVVAAVLAVALARSGAQRDFVFAFPWSGRDTPESLAAVGMFVNTLALRVDLRGAQSWREVLSRTRDSATTAYRNADAPFDSLASRMHPDRGLDRPPLTPVYLDFEAEVGDGTPNLAGGATYLPLNPSHVKFELELVVSDRGDYWEFALSYAVALFDRETAAGLTELLITTAGDLAADPDGRPLDVANRTARGTADS